MNGRTLIRLLLPALTVALAAAACTPRLEIPDRVGDDGRLTGESPVASEEPIEFAVGGGTKGQTPITTLTELAKRDFSVSAWYVAPGKAFRDGDATRIAYIANHRFGYLTNDPDHDAFSDAWRGVAAHAATTGAAATAPVYWPLDGSLTFFCYAPYRANAVLDTPPVPDTRDIVLEAPVTDAGVIARLPGYLPGSPLLRVTPAASAADQVDFLAAPAVLDKRRTDNAGRFLLDLGQHRMTQVEFWFAYKGPLQSDPSQTQTFEQARVSSIEIQNVVGSKYMYFTETMPYLTGNTWSDTVSPADPANSTAELPKTTYLLKSTEGGELKTGLDASLEDIENGGAYRFINDTPAGHLYLLPQTLPAGARLVINYTILNLYAGTRVSEVVTWNLDAGTVTAWPEGKVVRYLITLDLPARGSVGVKTLVIPWEDSGNVHNEQELLY